MIERAEQLISHSAEWIRLIIESFGVLVIAAGVLMTFVKLALSLPTDAGSASLLDPRQAAPPP